MSLYGDALAAIRRIALLDERTVRTTEQLRSLTDQVQSLRDRVSRLEGVIVGLTARPQEPASPTRPIPKD